MCSHAHLHTIQRIDKTVLLFRSTLHRLVDRPLSRLPLVVMMRICSLALCLAAICPTLVTVSGWTRTHDSRLSALLGKEASINDASFDQLIDAEFNQASEDSFASPEDDSFSTSRTIVDAGSADEDEEDAVGDQASINGLKPHSTDTKKLVPATQAALTTQIKQLQAACPNNPVGNWVKNTVLGGLFAPLKLGGVNLKQVRWALGHLATDLNDGQLGKALPTTPVTRKTFTDQLAATRRDLNARKNPTPTQRVFQNAVSEKNFPTLTQPAHWGMAQMTLHHIQEDSNSGDLGYKTQ